MSTYRTVALIDADICIYKVITTMEWCNSFEPVKKRLDGYIRDILVKTNATHYLGFLSPSKTFRNKLATHLIYKDKRKEKPKWFHESKNYLIKNWGFILLENIEADDAMAICQADDTIICTIDKDLKQVPGWHFHFVENKSSFVTEEEGNVCLWTQVITGDSTDNIQGIPGMGPKKAAEFLEKHKPKDWPMEILRLYVDAFKLKGPIGAMELMVETYKLVHMLREEAYGFVKPEPLPWHDPRKYDPAKDPTIEDEYQPVEDDDEEVEYSDDFDAMLDELLGN